MGFDVPVDNIVFMGVPQCFQICKVIFKARLKEKVLPPGLVLLDYGRQYIPSLYNGCRHLAHIEDINHI